MVQGDRNPEEENNNCFGDYSKEEHDLVNRTLIIPECMHYDILQVPPYSPIDDVVKSYRKLSLRLHPDKNKAPGAEEACKVINKAYEFLCDVEQKRRYDTLQLPLLILQQRQKTAHQQNKSEHSEPKQTQPHYNDFRQENMVKGIDDNLVKFLLFFGIPIFIMLMYPVLSYMFIPEEVFVLRKTGVYTEQRFTSYRRIPYYVKKDFRTDNLQQYYEIEDQVERKYYKLRQWAYTN